MIKKVNPTRIELIRLKTKLKMMKKGHQLLKKKRDGLMKEFLKIIFETKKKREEVEQEIAFILKFFLFARSEMRKKELEESVCWPKKEVFLEVKEQNIMGVKTPIFDLKEQGDILCYSPLSVSSNLDFALSRSSKFLKEIVKLAELERILLSLSLEIEKTRREVNALEYVYIPNIRKMIKGITLKLDERERLNNIILIKTKREINF